MKERSKMKIIESPRDPCNLRIGIEFYLRDVAYSMLHDLRQASASGRAAPESVESALVEFFMDQINGPTAPLAWYKCFIKDLATSATAASQRSTKNEAG